MSKFIFLAAYVLFILVIGIKSKRESSAGGEDYLLGGRTLGPVITSFSFAATYISGVCIVNAGMIGWKWGIGAIYNALGNVLLSIMFMWLILGRRSRTMSEKLGVQTLPDFLRVRYNSDFFKVAGSIIIFIFMVPYTATVFSSLSYLFESVFGLPYTLSLLAMAALGAFYLAIGGYKAAAKIDVAQGAIMLIGGLVIVYFTLKSDVVGGLSEGIARLSRIVTPEEGAIGQNLVSLNLGGSWTLLAGLIPFVLMTSFAPNGLPQLVSKFFAIKDAKQVKIGGIVCSVLGLLIITSVHVPGFFVRLFYPDQAAVDAAGGFNVLVPQILVNIMPDFFLSIILLLVLSASMSTLAGLVLTSSAALGMDFIKGYLKKDMKDEKVTLLMRVLTIVFVVLAVSLALMNLGAVSRLQSLAWGAMSGFFLTPYMYGILWKRTTKVGAMAGGIVGVACAVILPLAFKMSTINACFYALLVPIAVVPLVSLVTPKPSEKFLDFAYSTDMSVIGYDHAAEVPETQETAGK